MRGSHVSHAKFRWSNVRQQSGAGHVAQRYWMPLLRAMAPTTTRQTGAQRDFEQNMLRVSAVVARIERVVRDIMGEPWRVRRRKQLF